MLYMTSGVACIRLSWGFVYKGRLLFLILMDHLECVARDIGEHYVRHASSPLLPICLYNPAGLNGSFEDLGELVRADLRARGLGVPAVTLFRDCVPLADHYNVDADYVISRRAVTS